MKSILCYGDSNTYGYIPGGIGRYPREVRWTGLLQQKLGEEYYVIEEGLNARTTVWDDPIEDVMSGKTYLLPCLRTHRPLDGVILMLGTNNLKNRFFTSADDIARSIGTLVELIQKVLGEVQEIEPKILVVSPIEVGEAIVDTEDGILFSGTEGIQASKDFAKLYKQQAERHRCDFLSAAEFVSPSPVDCIHMNEAGHAALAEALYQKVRSMFEDK